MTRQKGIKVFALTAALTLVLLDCPLHPLLINPEVGVFSSADVFSP